MRLLVVLGLCCSVAVSHSDTLEKQWQKWKLEHGKIYTDLADEQARKDLWLQNYYQIVRHNQNEKSNFHLGLNYFSDLVMCKICSSCEFMLSEVFLM